MNKFKQYIEAKRKVNKKDEDLMAKLKRFNKEAYLSPFNKEKLLFLNDTKKVMPNGISSAHPPSNPEAQMKIKLFSSLKSQMDQDQHRKLQFQVRGQKEDFLRDRKELDESEISKRLYSLNFQRERAIQSYDPYDASYLEKQDRILNPKDAPIIFEQIQKKGKPALVIMDIAHRIIKQQELLNPHQKKLTELQKGQVACTYLKMNSEPKEYSFLKRFIDNEGDIQVPGRNPITGKRIDTQREMEKKEKEKKQQMINLQQVKLTEGSVQSDPKRFLMTSDDEDLAQSSIEIGKGRKPSPRYDMESPLTSQMVQTPTLKGLKAEKQPSIMPVPIKQAPQLHSIFSSNDGAERDTLLKVTHLLSSRKARYRNVKHFLDKNRDDLFSQREDSPLSGKGQSLLSEQDFQTTRLGSKIDSKTIDHREGAVKVKSINLLRINQQKSNTAMNSKNIVAPGTFLETQRADSIQSGTGAPYLPQLGSGHQPAPFGNLMNHSVHHSIDMESPISIDHQGQFSEDTGGRFIRRRPQQVEVKRSLTRKKFLRSKLYMSLEAQKLEELKMKFD